MVRKWLFYMIYCYCTLQANSLITDLHLSLSKEKYLTGNYNGYSVHHMRETDSAWMRPDVLRALEKMANAYEKDRAGLANTEPIIVVSSFRSFDRQKEIWEAKYQKNQAAGQQNTTEIIATILEYSSAPGTSRHHWGTDLDLNALENDYFEAGGKGEFLYAWLKENAWKFGFCQPYNEHSARNNTGYFEEKWHWSYFPVANKLLKNWVKALKNKKIKLEGAYLGSEHLTDSTLMAYVTSISTSCRKKARPAK